MVPVSWPKVAVSLSSQVLPSPVPPCHEQCQYEQSAQLIVEVLGLDLEDLNLNKIILECLSDSLCSELSMTYCSISRKGVSDWASYFGPTVFGHGLVRLAGVKNFMYAHKHTRMHTCIHTHMHTCMHTCIHTHMHTCMHTRLHTHMHTCMHTRIHTHMHTCTHTHTQGQHFFFQIIPTVLFSLRELIPLTKHDNRNVCFSPEAPHQSPKVQRRLTKKPAPPPPPDRPYSVAVTASMSRGTGNGAQTSQTWPRNVPLNSPESPPAGGAHQGDGGVKQHSPQERRPSAHERPHGPPPDRPSAPPPERPKAPPTLQSSDQQSSGGHQRSASTGAMHINTSAGPSPGSASHESLQAGMGTSLTAGHGNVLPSGTSTLGRHSSMRPARPNPPPPPPPINQHSEETHL